MVEVQVSIVVLNGYQHNTSVEVVPSCSVLFLVCGVLEWEIHHNKYSIIFACFPSFVVESEVASHQLDLCSLFEELLLDYTPSSNNCWVV